MAYEMMIKIAPMVRDIITTDPLILNALQGKAFEIKAKIMVIDHFIQEGTSQVCPYCIKVCCINRHSYYELEDLIYIFSLGEPLPDYREGLSDTDPCQFLSVNGCTIERYLRPFRCNWYFCVPLIDFMQAQRGADYRAFNRAMQEAIDLRREMIEIFKDAEGRQGNLYVKL